MRRVRTVQASIFDVFAAHEIGRELKAMSQWLDEHRDLLGLVATDLGQHGVKATGREGLPAEAVLRCALLKQQRQLSYEELAFHLEDSASFRAFARLPFAWTPKKSVLQKTISAIRPETWEEINRAVVRGAQQEKLEDGAKVRIDSTVTKALMHAPTDSSLLWDAVRVMVRLLKRASKLPSAAPIVWRNHRRLAKKRALAIQYSRGKERKAQLYRDLITATRDTMTALRCAAQSLADCPAIEAEFWHGEVKHYLPSIERLISQAERRVLAGEAVPVGEKLVSLFETHADIIVKGGRDVHYGHKLNLATGRSGIPRRRRRGRQSGRCRTVPSHARPSHRAPWNAAATGGQRWRLCQPRQPEPGKGLGRARCRLPQEARPVGRQHGQEPLGVSEAAKLPGRHRGQHILPEAGLRPGAQHMARAPPLHGLCLVISRRLQSRALRRPSVGLKLTLSDRTQPKDR